MGGECTKGWCDLFRIQPNYVLVLIMGRLGLCRKKLITASLTLFKTSSASHLIGQFL